jgi:organic hydroperoxide reductase OsmC/OhrA
MSSPVYFYDTTVQWKGQRRASLRAPGLPELNVSTPPEFKGETGLWTPEHLFVAAAEVCLMATFIGIAEISRLPVAAYRSEARGRLEKVEGQGLRFTEVVIAPTVELDKLEDLPLAERVMAKAGKGCLVANSMLTRIRVEPQFVEKAAAAA